MRFIVMFVTAVCVLFIIELRWPKKKNFYLGTFWYNYHVHVINHVAMATSF